MIARGADQDWHRDRKQAMGGQKEAKRETPVRVRALTSSMMMTGRLASMPTM